MLIVTRRKGESIMIGRDVVVTVISSKRDGTIRIGIDAPKSVEVHREEVYLKIRMKERREHNDG